MFQQLSLCCSTLCISASQLISIQTGNCDVTVGVATCDIIRVQTMRSNNIRGHRITTVRRALMEKPCLLNFCFKSENKNHSHFVAYLQKKSVWAKKFEAPKAILSLHHIGPQAEFPYLFWKIFFKMFRF